MEEDDDAEMTAMLDRLTDIYFDIGAVYGMLASIWAVYEVDDFLEVPYPAAETIRLDNECFALPAKATWLDLWRAADLMIWMATYDEDDDSDELHEPRFIEAIEPDPQNPTELVIQLGNY